MNFDPNSKPSPAVVIELCGGLGNQMFQYAAARALSIRLDADLFLDTSFYDKGRHRDFELHQFPIRAHFDPAKSSGQRSLRRIGHWFQSVFLPAPAIYHEPHYHFDPAFDEIFEPLRLQGYFQSPRYFDRYADAIRSELTPPVAADPESQRLAQALDAENSITIHVRRSDYVTSPKNRKKFYECSPTYYALALEFLPKDGPIVVLSDDIDWVKAHFSHDSRWLFAGQSGHRSGIADLWLMTRAKHHVIANSSFSWWGAWLANRPGGITIAPKHWFRDPNCNTHDQLPKNWIAIADLQTTSALSHVA